jgi:ABC-type sugar transport system permease subunit
MGSISSLFSNPINAFIMITVIICVVLLILLALVIKSQSKLRRLYIGILFLIAILYLLYIYKMIFLDSSTVILPNPTP